MVSHAEQGSTQALRRDIDECICIARCELNVAYLKIGFYEETFDNTNGNNRLRENLRKKRQKLQQALSLINNLEIGEGQVSL